MKIFLKIVFLLMVYSCGYQPLLVQKSDIIFFNETNIIGESKISKAILKNLNNYKGEGSDASLEIESNYSKSISSKNKKGDPEVFNIRIDVNIILNSPGKKLNKSFNETISYNNQSSNFELKKHENQIIQNITQKISQDIIFFFRSL
tara:strand:- start:1214 stop:1654 length:441 start_codon:yes stop_codon:yes gene_type:complete